jgi:hypothetical protein
MAWLLHRARSRRTKRLRPLRPRRGDDNVQYKAKTVYDFEDDTVEGDLQRPDGELVSSQKKARAFQPHRDPEGFHPEMLKSLEDV